MKSASVKYYGASIADIATLLSKDFIVLVFIAGVIACPVAYYFMDKWFCKSHRAG